MITVRAERKALGMISSLAVLILTVFTIAVFIVYGYSVLFYAILVVSLAFALFNAWLVAGLERQGGAPARRARRSKR